MKQKTAIIIEVYEKIESENTINNSITTRVEVYTDYADGYGFGTVCILPNITPKTISTLLSTIGSLSNDGFEIKVKYIEKSKYNDTAVKNLLH